MPFRLTPFRPDISRGRVGILSSFTRTVFDYSFSDLAVWYSLTEGSVEYHCRESKGIYPVPAVLTEQLEWVDFIRESGENLILNQPSSHFMKDLLLHPGMASAMALPLFEKNAVSDIVIVNSRKENHYGSRNSRKLQDLGEICSNLLYIR